MSDTYSPSPHRNRIFTRKNDGDALVVASDNVWLQALSDAVEQCARDVVSSPALTWQRYRAISTTHILRHACFNPVESRWYAVAENTNDRIEYSVNFGYDWASAGTASGLAFTDIACDPATGNMVAATLSTLILEYRSSTTTWTTRAAGLTGGQSGATVVWSSIAGGGLWCYAYRNAALGIQVYTSSDRVTWTQRTSGLPVTMTGYTGTNAPMLSSNAAGQVILLLDTGTGLARAGAVSNDGGLTWTSSSVGSTVVAAGATITRAQYSVPDGVWMTLISGSAPVSEAWTSPDGVTWTRAYASSSGVKLTQVATTDSLWAAIATDAVMPYLCYSIDVGVTWRRADVAPMPDTIAWLWAAQGGLLWFGETGPNVAQSARIGQTGQTV